MNQELEPYVDPETGVLELVTQEEQKYREMLTDIKRLVKCPLDLEKERRLAADKINNILMSETYDEEEFHDAIKLYTQFRYDHAAYNPELLKAFEGPNGGRYLREFQQAILDELNIDPGKVKDEELAYKSQAQRNDVSLKYDIDSKYNRPN